MYKGGERSGKLNPLVTCLESLGVAHTVPKTIQLLGAIGAIRGIYIVFNKELAKLAS